jgi:glycosyltransferase involved in cell wall biosynthesis
MLIREARFTVYPSEWYENCPFSVMESQMYGTPVLGADIGGIPELIRVGETGELFESGNELQLRLKLEEMWRVRKTLQCMGGDFDSKERYVQKYCSGADMDSSTRV